MDHLSTEEEFM